MYNPEQPRPQAQQLMEGPRVSFSSDFALEPPPRMSFSSDFALEPPPPPRPSGRADADFEFSPAGSRPMMDADQLFSKGRILPLREAAAAAARPPPTTTLRAELRARPDDADRGGRRGPPRWKELLGLKRAHRKGAAGAGAAADAHVDLGEHGEADAGE